MPQWLPCLPFIDDNKLCRLSKERSCKRQFQPKAKGGKQYRPILAAFERIFGANMFFSTESTRSTATVIHRSRFNFLQEAEIWYSRSVDAQPAQNAITLCDEFYSEISRHPIPAGLEATKVLAAAPALLDLFM